jgi:Ca2+-binding RTX toxin-like protein
MRTMLALAMTVGTLVAAAPAAASQAFISSDARLHYVAAPGETNSPLFAFEVEGLRLTDAGATVVAGEGCVQDGAGALCNVDLFEAAFVIALGDGDDIVDVRASSLAIVSGGVGDDQIIGSLGENRLDGGPGNDVLTGGDWPDTILGGEGDDQIVGGQDSDRLFGGPGNDTVRGGLGMDDLSGGLGEDILNGNSGFDWVDAVGDVNFLLKPGVLTGLGRDRLSQIEGAFLVGGAGANVINARGWGGMVFLSGLRGDDVLVGGVSSDELDGGRGEDRILGGRGFDILMGGGGNDTFLARDREFDNVYGDSGADTARVDFIDVALDVERVLR